MGNLQSWLKQGNEAQDERHQQDGAAEASSAWGMLLTFAPVAASAAVIFIIFLFLRKSQRRFYAPRTYLGSLREHERSPTLPTGWFNWIGTFWKMPDAYALRHQSLDAYLFLRFLRICTSITFFGACIIWPVIFPINITGGGGQTQLDLLSWSNVDTESQSGRYRLYAHVFMAWIFYGFVLYMVFRECVFYINLRQAFLLTPQYASRVSSRTVLFTSVPSAYLDEDRLRKMFSDSVKHVWIMGDTTKVDEVVEERDKIAMKLEKAEVKLIKMVNKERNKAIKDGASEDKTPPPRDPEGGSVASRWIPTKKRPSHRLGPLGLLGKKVDTIEYCRTELQRLVPEAETAQHHYKAGGFKKIPAVFVEFYTQSDAQAAYQTITHHQALHMTPKFIGVTPDQVVWKSLKISWWQRIIRVYAVWAFIIALIVFWAIPVAVVGVISKVETLKTVPGLTWLGDLPEQVLGLIGGLLPSVLLAVLMALVPVIMRFCAKLAGEVSDADVELFTQKAYFIFQFVQVFLIRTISDTTVGLLTKLAGDPTAVFGVLSESIPTSSTFYISYFILQGLTVAAGVIAQITGFIIFTLLYKFFASTPRALYTKWTKMSAILWGSVLPIYTNIALVSLVYALIAPLILFWATVALGLFYLAYRYNILFVTETRIDTRGLIYPRALKQLLTGVYVAEICLVGMFSVSRAIGPVVLMAVFLVFTIFFHVTLKKSLDPLLYNLPRSLQVEEESQDTDLAGATGVDPGQENVGKAPVDKTKTVKKVVPGGEEAFAERKGNFLMKFFKPWDFADYPTLRRLVPHEVVEFTKLSPELAASAYYPPSVNNLTPILWIPEDPAGVSKQEVAHTSKVIPITDEGCSLDDKNKIVWDTEGARPPIWDEKVYY